MHSEFTRPPIVCDFATTEEIISNSLRMQHSITCLHQGARAIIVTYSLMDSQGVLLTVNGSVLIYSVAFIEYSSFIVTIWPTHTNLMLP